MKTPDRFNKPYFYTYLTLVIMICSLETLVMALVFKEPLAGLLLAIPLGILALIPVGSGLERLSRGLGRLEIGQAPQVETQRDFWNPLIGLLRQLNRLGGLTGSEIGAAASLAEQGAAQQERNRLGRELHDSIKQQLFSIQMSASAVQARWEEDPQGARAALQDVLQSSQAALAEMNALLQQLSPVPLERVGLAQALKDQCEALAYRAGAQVTCEVGELPAEDWLPVGAFEALFRVAQEALSNISRHARPSKVGLSLQPDAAKGLLVLSITDDGLGFDPAGIQPGGGLNNMRTRLEALGGSFSIKTATGKGVQLLAALPVHPPEQAEALTPVKANPFLNRAALVGLGGGILAALALILPVYDSIGKYLDSLWDVSRFLGTTMVLLAMLIGVLMGWLASRWVKPGTIIGSSLVGTLAGLVAGATAFGLIVAGFAAVDGATGLLDFGMRPASVAETARLLSGAITGQFQAIHRFFWDFLILGALYGTFGGFLTWRKSAPAREGIAWEAPANLVCTLLALGSGLALIAGTPALLVSEPALFGMHGQAGILVSTSILWSVLWVLGTPFFFYLLSMIASYGLLRRELQSTSSTIVYHAHWRAFDFGLLGMIVPAGMGIGLALTLGDAPVISPSLVLGIMFVSLAAAGPFFWQVVTTRQRLLGQMVRVPNPWMYIVVGASLLLPVLAFYALVSQGAYWILPFAMLVEALLIMGAMAFRRKLTAPGQAAQWRTQAAQGLAGWLAGIFALVLPMMPMIASATGILNLPVYFANVLDQERLGWTESVRWTRDQLVQNTFRWEMCIFGGLLLLAGLAIGLYLLLLALRLAASKKRL